MWLNRKFLSMAPLPIADDEQLARFVLHSDWIRADQTVRQNAFIPHPYTDLSVTRHKGFSEKQIWNMGRNVATAQSRTLYGRADVSAGSVRQQPLKVEPKPLKGNPNHANIVGWPTEKSAQKTIAQELAAGSVFHKI